MGHIAEFEVSESNSATSVVIEGLRGVAALMVLGHHYTYAVEHARSISLIGLHFFHSGVDLFFVITGYLFAPYILGMAQMKPWPFVIRRFFRLYPLYLISLALMVICFSEGGEQVWADVLRHLLMIQTIPFFTLEQAGAFSLVYWTLPVEVAFYALIALFLWRRASNREWVTSPSTQILMKYVTMGLISGALWLGFVNVGYITRDPRWVMWQAQLPALLPAFWMGLSVYLLQKNRRFDIRWAKATIAIGLVSLVVLLLIYPIVAAGALTGRPFGWFNLACAIGFGLSMAGLFRWFEWRTVVPTGVFARVCVTAGGLSYAVYLLHEWALRIVQIYLPTVDVIVRISFSVILTLGLAFLLHNLVEIPARNFGRRIASRYLVTVCT